MSSFLLSNLQVRPNLLSADGFDKDMLRCSVFELRNIRQRMPNLVGLADLPPARQQEWRESLFWGDNLPPPVDPGWAEPLAAGMDDAVRRLEERPSLEAAFELLLVARQLYDTRPEGPARAAAAEWDRRLCEVLARDEFRYTPDMIDQRVESVVGRRLARPEPSRAASRLPPPPATHPDPGPLFEPRIEPRPTRLWDSSTPAIPVPVLDPSNGTPPPRPAVSVPPVPPVPPEPAVGPPAATASSAPAKPTTTISIRDPDLKRVIHRWGTLPDHVKECVLMLLDAADATAKSATE